VLAVHALTGRPADLAAWVIAVTGAIPVALVVGATTRAANRIDRLLAHTVSIAGLTALIVVVYTVVLLALGRRPEESERSLLLLSMGAAAVAALLWLPARRWLTDAANRLVYSERVAPDEALRTWGSRLTRAIPLDELLLQLCESLRKSMNLTAAEVWTDLKTERHIEGFLQGKRLFDIMRWTRDQTPGTYPWPNWEPLSSIFRSEKPAQSSQGFCHVVPNGERTANPNIPDDLVL